MKITTSGALRPGLLAIGLWLIAPAAIGSEVEDILNFRAYSSTLYSAGQPTELQLQLLAENDFDRVIYLAFSDHDRALAHEDRIVEGLGMDFVHIPVLWGAPAADDFRAFAAALESAPEQKTLVHCELNFRASSLTFLYRVLHLDVPLDEALEDLQDVWVPDATWQAFIFATLEDHGVSPHCDACFW